MFRAGNKRLFGLFDSEISQERSNKGAVSKGMWERVETLRVGGILEGREVWS